MCSRVWDACWLSFQVVKPQAIPWARWECWMTGNGSKCCPLSYPVVKPWLLHHEYSAGGLIWHGREPESFNTHSKPLSLCCQFLTVAALTTCNPVFIFQSVSWTTSVAPSLPYIDRNKGLDSTLSCSGLHGPTTSTYCLIKQLFKIPVAFNAKFSPFVFFAKYLSLPNTWKS